MKVVQALDEKPASPFDLDQMDKYKVLEEDGVRKVLTYPRVIPRKVRDDIAKFLVDEMRSELRIRDIRRFMQRFGAFYPILTFLQEMQKWKDLKELVRYNEVGQALVLIHLLPLVFQLLEDMPKAYKAEWAVDDKVSEIMERFKRLMDRTMELWGNEVTSPDAMEWAKVGEQMDRLLTEDELGAIGETIRRALEEMLGGVVDNFSENYEIMETLLLLFPGNFWDYSRRHLHSTFLGNLEKYASILRKNSQLRDILDMLGRIDIEYTSRYSELTHFGASEVFSTHTSSDLKHVLPSELVKLKDPTMRNLFFSQFIEGKLLTYQLRGNNWDGKQTKREGRKGPVIAIVDTSGSMSGAPEVTAKAIVLAAAKKLLKEGRDLKVILFSSTNDIVSIELTNEKMMAVNFLEFLQLSFGGGTDFNTALAAGVHSLKQGNWKDADLLFLTDGYSVLSNMSVLEDWKTLKEEHGVRCFTIIIGNDQSGGLEPITDHAYYLKRAGSWDIRNSPARFLRDL